MTSKDATLPPHHSAPHRTATCGKVSSQAWAPNDAHRSTLSKLQTTLPGNQREGEREAQEPRGRMQDAERETLVVVDVVRAKERQKEATPGEKKTS